eukprot:COSAG01_NODE_4567_length_4918_cov_3.696203_4_plen_46_part_00
MGRVSRRITGPKRSHSPLRRGKLNGATITSINLSMTDLWPMAYDL